MLLHLSQTVYYLDGFFMTAEPDFSEETHNSSDFPDEFNRRADVAVTPGPEVGEQVQQLRAEGQNLLSLKDFAGALACYNHALELQPDSPQLWHERGLVLRQMKRYKGAIANFDLALHIQPEYLPASLSRVFTLLRYQRQLSRSSSSDRLEQRQKLRIDARNLLMAFVQQKLPALVVIALASYIASQNRAISWMVAGLFLAIVTLSDLLAESQR